MGNCAEREVAGRGGGAHDKSNEVIWKSFFEIMSITSVAAARL